MNTILARPVAGTNGSVRTSVSQFVTSTSMLSKEPKYAVWQRIYIRLEATFGIDINTYPRRKGESLLTVAEHYDLLDKVYSLAFAEFLYVQNYE